MNTLNPYAPPAATERDKSHGDGWKRFENGVVSSTLVIVPALFGLGWAIEAYPALIDTVLFQAIAPALGLMLIAWYACFVIAATGWLFLKVLWLARFLISSFHFLCRVARIIFCRGNSFSRHFLSHFNSQGHRYVETDQQT